MKRLTSGTKLMLLPRRVKKNKSIAVKTVPAGQWRSVEGLSWAETVRQTRKRRGLFT